MPRRSGRLLAFCLLPSVCAGASSPPVVLLDAWFNSQQHPGPDGRPVLYHYKWNDTADSGFSRLGQMFRGDGASTETLAAAPTSTLLSQAAVYIIVAPDTLATNPRPHAVTPADAETIAAWVRGGGVLLLMANDPAHADIAGLDRVADRFGLHFNDVLAHHVEGRNLSQGMVTVPAGSPIFHSAYTLFLKDTCSLSLTGGARPVATDSRGAVLMATARYGKGTVFAVADPWLYNEYTGSASLPAPFDNAGAGRALVRWLLRQTRHA